MFLLKIFCGEIFIFLKNTKKLSYLLGRKNKSSQIENLFYSDRFLDHSNVLIDKINSNIAIYNEDKRKVETLKQETQNQKKRLEYLARNTSNKLVGQKTELANVSQKKQSLNQERKNIQKKLSKLSQKQKELLQEKTETFITSVGDVPTTGDRSSRPDYDPGFKKAFGVFSFGAPHRKGMSQYGAKGRADKGQNYKEILKAYYGDIDIKKRDIPNSLNTDKGSMSIDGKYLKGLAEMPASWPIEALKAQAIAARTYALSYVGWRMNNKKASGRICTTENCQVWSSSKASSSSAARWHKAVEDNKRNYYDR